MKRLTSYLLKILLCILCFFIGLVFNWIVLEMLGFQMTKILSGTSSAFVSILKWIFIGSILLTLVLSLVSRNLKTNWLVRWFLLLEIFWLLGIGVTSVGLTISVALGVLANITVSLLVMLSLLLPGLILSGLVTMMFKPTQFLEIHPKTNIYISKARSSINIL